MYYCVCILTHYDWCTFEFLSFIVYFFLIWYLFCCVFKPKITFFDNFQFFSISNYCRIEYCSFKLLAGQNIGRYYLYVFSHLLTSDQATNKIIENIITHSAVPIFKHFYQIKLQMRSKCCSFKNIWRQCAAVTLSIFKVFHTSQNIFAKIIMQNS